MNEERANVWIQRIMLAWVFIDFAWICICILGWLDSSDVFAFTASELWTIFSLTLVHSQLILGLFWLFVGLGRFSDIFDTSDFKVILAMVFCIGMIGCLPLCLLGLFITLLAGMPAMYLRWNRIFLVYVPESLQIKQKNQVSLLWLFGLTTCAAVIMGTLRVLADSIYFDNALAFSFPILLWSIVPLLMILGTLKPKWLYHSIPCTFAILAILLLPFLFREDYRQNAWTAVVYSASLYCILIVHLVFLRVCGYRLITYPKV